MKRRPKNSNYWLALTVLSVSGCAISPERGTLPELAHPDEWTAASGAQTGAPEAWLSDFNSPELEALVDEALRYNPNLQITAARFQQALAEAAITRADQLPVVGLNLDGNRQQISTFGPTTSDGTIFENYNLGFDINWEIDLWGRLSDQTDASLAELEATEAELRGARLSLTAQVTKAWFNYLTATELVKLAEKTVQTYENNTKTMEARFKRGLSDGLNLRRIRSQASSALADLTIRERELDQASRILEQVLGRYPSAELTTQTPLPEPPAMIPPGLPSELLTRRPDLVAAERRLFAAELELSASQKLRLPQLSLTASGGTSSQEFNNLLDDNFSVWLLGANLTQPIYQGGRIQAGIKRSEALLAQAEASYREAAIQAFYEVESALSAEGFLRAEEAALKLASAEADRSEALAWGRFRNGTTEFIDALDTERTAAAARVQHISTRNQLLQNRIDLYLALGGPFDQES
ncbi:MAG: TolC family protein [Verrucomicrobiota bacterium]